MAMRYYQQPVVAPPPQLAIPFGKFIAIDEKYHELIKPQKTDSFSKGKTLVPHGKGVNYQPTGFVEYSPSLALDAGSLKVNYGSYIYDQLSGFDYAHPRDVKTVAQATFV
jgi:hypothetical protein